MLCEEEGEDREGLDVSRKDTTGWVEAWLESKNSLRE